MFIKLSGLFKLKTHQMGETFSPFNDVRLLQHQFWM